MKNKTKAYLASPWFSPKQKEVMDKVRSLLLEMDFDVFAPFYDGICLTKEIDSPEMRKKVFEIDVMGVVDADLVVAVVDDFDVGVMVECGVAVRGNAIREIRSKTTVHGRSFRYRSIPIIAYSDVTGRGLNVMLQMACSGGFANGLEQLREQLQRYKDGREPADFLKFEIGDFV